jgi:WD40 repeat protein
MHPSKGKYYKNLLLSASLDWTVKLWNLSHTTTPLMQFYTSSYDYVCDVQWSPLNPTVFCTILSGGDLTLWDLCKSTSEPIEIMKISNNDSSKGALNKCIWSNNGNNVIIGAGSVVTKNIPSNSTVYGNPAKIKS